MARKKSKTGLGLFLTAAAVMSLLPNGLRPQAFKRPEPTKPEFTKAELAYIRSLPKREKRKAVVELRRKYAFGVKS